MDDPEAVERGYARQARSPFNLTGHPALALPIGFTEAAPDAPALPLSMQIVSRHFDEASAYRIAAAYESAAGQLDRHPPLEG
jgi:aspartyl-tRNA(Asn)/glutamyl-tRNA(Gln) amidotransferase subunit A